jgi:hypothetical protein
MLYELDPQLLTLAGIAQRCAQETERFFQRQSHDPRYCFELFRRAILQHDSLAWELIHTQYQPLVTRWVQRHPAFEVSGEELQYFVNRTFEKLWVALTPEKFGRFSDLQPLLRYLKMCVHSVIIDHTRSAEQSTWDIQAEESAAENIGTGPAIENGVLDQIYQHQLWEWINSRLNDEKERVVMYGSFALALKPRELFSQFRTMFSDVDEVYRIKQNILARLRRDPEFKKLLDKHD